MQVLFLAAGATRRRAVATETAAVVEAGGRAVVVLEDQRRWQTYPLASGVEVVDLIGMGRSGRLLRVERKLLFGGVRFVAKQIGRWKLRGPVRKLRDAYERLLANRIHRRLFMPVYRRLADRERIGLIERQVLAGNTFDTMVVIDPGSMPDAVRILDGYTARGEPAPAVAFSVDHAGIPLSPVGGPPPVS